MTTPVELRFRQISSARQQLLRLCQRLDHGRIEHLVIRNGEPCFNPLPRLVANRLGAPPRRQHALGDFVLKQAQRHLLETVEHLRDGLIERIEIINGLPTRVVLATPSQTKEGGRRE